MIDPLHIEKNTWQHPHGIDLMKERIWNQEIRQDKVARSMELLSVSILNEKPPSDLLICYPPDLEAFFAPRGALV